MQMAKSFVMNPLSMVETQTSSSVLANFSSAGLESNLALCKSPLVQAKIDAVNNRNGITTQIDKPSDKMDLYPVHRMFLY